jgi:hypothetical protein
MWSVQKALARENECSSARFQVIRATVSVTLGTDATKAESHQRHREVTRQDLSLTGMGRVGSI